MQSNITSTLPLHEQLPLTNFVVAVIVVLQGFMGANKSAVSAGERKINSIYDIMSYPSPNTALSV